MLVVFLNKPYKRKDLGKKIDKKVVKKNKN